MRASRPTGKSVETQVRRLRAAGARRVFREVASGARAARSQLQRAIAKLEGGDVLMVMRLDRLARSTRDLLNTLAAIAEKNAGFRSLGDVWADTTTPHGKLMLTVLSGLAEFERSLIMCRTQAGIARARELGVAFGRPARLNPRQKRLIAERYATGATMRELADEFDVGEATIWRALRSEPT